MTRPFPEVTVLTVVRNDAAGLAKTLASVAHARAHGRRAIRHVVVDGASTDGTLAVVEAHAAAIDHWVSERDRGIYDAMNKSARLAEAGSLLIWINAGDELLPLDTLLDGMPADAEAIFAAVQLPNGTTIAPRILRPYDERHVFPLTVFRHQGFFIRAEAFARLGGYRLDVGSQADGLLMSQAVRSLRCADIPLPAAVFQLDGVSNTRHRAVLQSYFKVTAALGMSRWRILWHQRAYLAKMALKIALPQSLTAQIMRLRWGVR